MNKIAELNDRFRKTFQGGRVVTTAAFAQLPSRTKAKALQGVREFSTFTPDNDPYGDHEFGSFEVDGETIMFKIDCYDPTMQFGSEDPANPAVTVRVLTVMLASDY